MKSLIAALALFACFQFDAQAMGVIRRLTNEVPPVVITNAPPVVTNAPPVVVPPVVQPTTWSVKEIKSYSGETKIKTIAAVPRGILISHYNRTSREDSYIDELNAGTWRTIYRGNEETIGAVVDPEPEPATVLGATLYLQAERGKNVLRYDLASGKISKGATLSLDYKWNVENSEWKAKGTVAFGGTGPSKPATIFSAITGEKLFTSPLNGLVAGLAEDSNGILWLAISDNQKGVCNSVGWKSQGIKPASVAAWLDTIYAGSQVDGWIYRLDGEKWTKVYDTKASKVNRLVVDTRDNCLLAAASNPDHILRIRPDGVAETLGRWTDQPQTVSGEQFDCTVNPGPSNTILGARALKVGAKAYQFTPSGTQAPQPPVKPSTEAIDWSAVTWMNGDFSAYQPKAKMDATPSSDGTIWFRLSNPIGGTDSWAGSICERDGKLYGGIVDGVGDGSKTVYRKGKTNFGANSNAKGGPLWAGSSAAQRAKFKPRENEKMWTFIISKSSQTRTEPAPMTWKE